MFTVEILCLQIPRDLIRKLWSAAVFIPIANAGRLPCTIVLNDAAAYMVRLECRPFWRGYQQKRREKPRKPRSATSAPQRHSPNIHHTDYRCPMPLVSPSGPFSVSASCVLPGFCRAAAATARNPRPELQGSTRYAYPYRYSAAGYPS